MIAARALLLAGAGRRGIREREPNAFSLPQILNQFIQRGLVLNKRILTLGRDASSHSSCVGEFTGERCEFQLAKQLVCSDAVGRFS